ncbi:TenA family protein [Actinomadura roseirufa]|uniref:TenA family protein n=1 Tax=Actinomadura roseirufa TaxID=2094049 RepID=UPI001A954D12|nr:TenA family transcriptional regulator [Actinomadura roseirufa]
MRAELSAIAGPVVSRITEHPFWAGLRRGTLPPAALWYFAEQDAHHVVPAYARALAGCAAIAGGDRHGDRHGALLASAASATFGSLPRLDGELGKLAAALGRDPGAAAPPGPGIHAYTSFMLAAPASPFPAAIGGLLPMTWFHLLVSADLRERHDPSSRYADWIAQYLPEGDYLQEYVDGYLDMIDEVAAGGSDRDRALLAGRFRAGARLEWEFADSAWRRREWPV